MRQVEMLDVLAPALTVIGSIALVAVAYLGITALKDRMSHRRDEDGRTRPPKA